MTTRPRKKRTGRKLRKAPGAAAHRRSAVADPSKKVERLTRALREAREQQAATSEVLNVISRAVDLQPVLDAVLSKAVLLCGADRGFIFRQDGDLYQVAASCGHSPEFIEIARRNPISRDRRTATGRAVVERAVVHIRDILTDPEYRWAEDGNNPASAAAIKEVEGAAARVDLKLTIVTVRDEIEFDSAFVRFIREGVGALLVSADPYFNTRRAQLVGLAARYRLPAIYEFREFAVAGGLVSYGSNLANAYRQVGDYTGRMETVYPQGSQEFEQPESPEVSLQKHGLLRKGGGQVSLSLPAQYLQVE
jgi:hypothetical protein